MNIKNIIAVIAGFMFYFLLRGIVFSYDNKIAHGTFNGAIIKFIEGNSSKYFPSNYEIDISADQTKYRGIAVNNLGLWESTYGEGEADYTIWEWIIHGGISADEPEVQASVRHFYDPVQLVGAKYLTNEGTSWEHHYSNPQTDAIEWAMGDTPKGAENKWTLIKGKEYFIAALGTADDETKNNYLAKAFRCLGEVLHNTGDMGCPPHTRNDSHAAPVGESLGAIFGSPDPYEEQFNPGNISIFLNDDPDPELKSFFENTTTIRSINEKLAEFTNANFFTKETINGVGHEIIHPINKEGTYPRPLLQDFLYDNDDYTYYKILPYNNYKIIMLKDKGYWWNRTYPYIDRECVRNQAQYLIPNIICAGANVVRLFIPKFEVKINSANSSGQIEGKVTHKATSEYSSNISYSGKIIIYDNENFEEIGELDCIGGKFDGTLTDWGNHKEVYANLEIAGIKISSEVYELSGKPMVTGCLVQTGNIEANVTIVYSDGSTSTESGWYSDEFFSHTDEPSSIFTFENNEYKSSFDYTSSSGIHYSGTSSVKFDEELKNILIFSVNRRMEYEPNTPYGYVKESSVSGHDIPIDPNNTNNIWFRTKGIETCDKIDNMSYQWITTGYTENKEIKNCNEDSKIEILVGIK